MTNVINTLKHATLAASVAASVTTGAVAQDSAEAQNIAVANSYFTAVQTGDLEALGALVAPDVVWHQPGDNQFSGTHESAQAVFGMIGGMMQDTQGSFVVKQNGDIMANGDLVSVEVAFSGKKGNASIDMTGHDLFKIKNGKIVEVWLFSQDQKAEDAFWGK